MLKLGTTSINALKLGTTDINKAYLGTNTVFSNSVQITLADTDLSTADSNSYSVTLDIGGTDQNSYIIFNAVSRRTAGDADVSGVTADGVAMTNVATAKDTSGGADINTMWIIDRSSLPDPSQTNVDFVITFTQTMLRCAFATYSMIGAGSATPSYVGTDTTLTVATLSLTDVDVPANGAALATVYAVNNTSPTNEITWVGLNEDFDFAVESASNAFSGASDEFATTQTNITVSATMTVSAVRGELIVASWGP